jgi:hypothetical protein
LEALGDVDELLPGRFEVLIDTRYFFEQSGWGPL